MFRFCAPRLMAKAEAKKAPAEKGGGGASEKGAKIGSKQQKATKAVQQQVPSAVSILAQAAEKPKKTAAQKKEEKMKRKEKKLAKITKNISKNRFNFWELLARFPDFGIGKRVRRTLWPIESHTYFTITRVDVKQLVGGPIRGKAWGIFTWRGKPQQKEKRITSIYKREWKLFKLQLLSEPLPVKDTSFEIAEPPMPAVFGRFPTKHPVPRGFFPAEQVRADWYTIPEMHKNPIPGLSIDPSYTNWDLSKLPRKTTLEEKLARSFSRFDLKKPEKESKE